MCPAQIRKGSMINSIKCNFYCVNIVQKGGCIDICLKTICSVLENIEPPPFSAPEVSIQLDPGETENIPPLPVRVEGVRNKVSAAI